MLDGASAGRGFSTIRRTYGGSQTTTPVLLALAMSMGIKLNVAAAAYCRWAAIRSPTCVAATRLSHADRTNDPSKQGAASPNAWAIPNRSVCTT